VTLRVLAFTPAPESGAAGRYRVFQYREPLRALGIELEPAPFLDEDAFGRLYRPGGVMSKSWDLARRTRLLLARLHSARRYDLALVHRELWPLAGGWPLALLERRQPRWVFDLDDAVFLPNVSDANRRFVGLKAHGSVAPVAAGARAVAAGNAWLAAWARSQRPGRPADEVEVIPTVVDSERWTPVAPQSDGAVRLLWIGSPTTLRYLETWGAGALAPGRPALAARAARDRFPARAARPALLLARVERRHRADDRPALPHRPRAARRRGTGSGASAASSSSSTWRSACPPWPRAPACTPRS
jgi:hypothetical protein